MTIDHTTTFKATLPMRPGISQIRYARKVNDTSAGPLPADGPSAEEWDQMSETLAALAATGALLLLSVVGGSSPAIDAMGSVRDDVLVGTFTVTHAATGVVEITWPADMFPAAQGRPMATINGSTHGFIATESMTQGVRVRTANTSGTPADLPFTVLVF